MVSFYFFNYLNGVVCTLHGEQNFVCFSSDYSFAFPLILLTSISFVNFCHFNSNGLITIELVTLICHFLAILLSDYHIELSMSNCRVSLLTYLLSCEHWCPFRSENKHQCWNYIWFYAEQEKDLEEFFQSTAGILRFQLSLFYFLSYAPTKKKRYFIIIMLNCTLEELKVCGISGISLWIL